MEPLMPELNDYQAVAHKELSALLNDLNVRPTRNALTGRQEATIEIEADGVRIWIYADGACVVGRGVDRVLEKWDYDSPAELLNEFLLLVRQAFQRTM